ncbi:uncharacterized protein MONOS_7219 [Monocercomonoides exilis]|uniref:uncharacterized protein n=1 Tax=Monocercomonoides exilis TaxID=2049356 RepID=UPI003559F60E|nr:hypothetical protein MONOS_7219 [Monocercomonoides exilis]|eukprot:MONOS_7219.1-p1 / transcript=MONOS_7219.1 / gene=MONOS_7219 / organism=Monocercomonoides_exilis_PA203 / gene_product=unspecified product / transcript_product=unspecified product / location=Mono_scaffold00241:57323-58174(+) / protein_length=124 / sequence_SO=supercontig / SO=protein_coding / is_pseudo=false
MQKVNITLESILFFIESRRIETFAHTSAFSSTSSFVFSTVIVIGTDDTAQLKVLLQEDMPTEVELQTCGTWELSMCACLVVKHESQQLSISQAVPAGTMIASLATGSLMVRVCGKALHTTAPS